MNWKLQLHSFQEPKLSPRDKSTLFLSSKVTVLPLQSQPTHQFHYPENEQNHEPRPQGLPKAAGPGGPGWALHGDTRKWILHTKLLHRSPTPTNEKEESGKTRDLFPHECAKERYSTKKDISGLPFTGDPQGEQPGRTPLGMRTHKCQELVLFGGFVPHLFCLGWV